MFKNQFHQLAVIFTLVYSPFRGGARPLRQQTPETPLQEKGWFIGAYTVFLVFAKTLD